MKRLVPVLAVFGICLLACLGWVAGRPQTVSANFVVNDEHHKDHNGDNDRDKDRDKDRNNDDHSCRADDQRHDEGSDQSDRKHDSEGNDHHADHEANLGSFLTTINNYGTGVASRSVITLHRDHTMSVIDSGQGGPGTQFSSQLGTWRHGCDEAMKGRTLDFSFPGAGIARVDYQFDPDQPEGTIKGTIILTTFPLNGNPQTDTGTVAGHFEFTGTRIRVP